MNFFNEIDLLITSLLNILSILGNNQNEPATPLTRAYTLNASEFVTLINTIHSTNGTDPPEKWSRPSSPNEHKDAYDFIVVGAGSSGLTLAARLSENAGHEVLLIEAGDDPRLENDFPALIFLLQKTSMDWEYYTKPTDACQGMDGEGCFWPRGKVLGGSSSINAMLYARGMKGDFDGWGNKCEGWSYDDCLPYFKKTEGNLNTNLSTEYHNTTGPMKVNILGPLDELQLMFVESYKKQGYEYYEDMNADKYFGLWNSQGTFANNRRQSTAYIFRDELLNRPNLHVLKNTLARKILINKKNQAYGVEIDYGTKLNSRKMNVYAKKEVIVSSGAINSPQLLMLSGIGPADHLKQMRIPVRKDLPMVGQGLRDHLYNTIWLKYNTLSSEKDLPTVLNSGVFSIPLNLMGFIDTKTGLEIPDVEVIIANFFPNSPDLKAYMKTVGYKLEIQQSLLEVNSVHPVGLIATILLHPKSAGSIYLKDKNPYVYPDIYPNYFNDPDDVETLVRAAIQTASLTETDEYKSIGLEFIQLPIAECNEFAFNSEDYWRKYIKYMTTTVYHPVGTCSMGKEEDGVVDNDLKVHGVENLRVADASIMPVTISGHTNAACIMIGEKAADIIKQQYP